MSEGAKMPPKRCWSPSVTAPGTAADRAQLGGRRTGLPGVPLPRLMRDGSDAGSGTQPRLIRKV
jgi:hypothetical protein